MKNKILALLGVITLVSIFCVGCSIPKIDEIPEVTILEKEEYQETSEENIEEDVKEETEESTDTMVSNVEFILVDSDVEVVSSLMLSEMALEELRIARNEIYARHGLIFTSADLAEYFEGKPWYDPSITSVDDIQLNYTEQVNVQLIQELEKMKGEDTNLLASLYSMETLSIEDDILTIQVKEDSLCSYVTFTGSWDYLGTTDIRFALAENCEWYMCSPLALHEDYSDAIESSEDEIMSILMEEMDAKNKAQAKDEPYDTSISLMIKIVDEEIVCVYQVAA